MWPQQQRQWDQRKQISCRHSCFFNVFVFADALRHSRWNSVQNTKNSAESILRTPFLLLTFIRPVRIPFKSESSSPVRLHVGIVTPHHGTKPCCCVVQWSRRWAVCTGCERWTTGDGRAHTRCRRGTPRRTRARSRPVTFPSWVCFYTVNTFTSDNHMKVWQKKTFKVFENRH